MERQDCISFLQWVLPQLGLQWRGYRRVHGQVCKRLKKRIKTLQLQNTNDYRQYLKQHSEEWLILREFCHITISRFYRDRAVYQMLGEVVLPKLYKQAEQRGDHEIRVWSAGCHQGEEPYSVAALCHLLDRRGEQRIRLKIYASDINTPLLIRARQGLFSASSLREIPDHLRTLIFDQRGADFQLKKALREQVCFFCHDIRQPPPLQNMDVILCRNLVFTYFDRENQLQVIQKIWQALVEGGALVIACHEQLPALRTTLFEPWTQAPHTFRKVGPAGSVANSLALTCYAILLPLAFQQLDKL